MLPIAAGVTPQLTPTSTPFPPPRAPLPTPSPTLMTGSHHCRLLSFCAHVAARLPFRRCDEPYTLVHLINATISRRAAFVLSAQKASLDAALQQETEPPAHTSAAPKNQQGRPAKHAGPQGSGAAAPEDSERVMKSTGGAQQIAVGGAEAVPAEIPGNDTGDQVTPVHGLALSLRF